MSEFLHSSGVWVIESGAKSDRVQEATVAPIQSLDAAPWGQSKYRDFQDFLRAVDHPYVWACLSLIAYTFASNEYALVDIETGAPETDPSDPFLQLWERPNPFQTCFQFCELLIEYLELTGNAYITLENRDGYGRPRELYLPDPSRMVVVPDPKNYIAGYYFDTTGLSRGPSGGWNNRRIPYGTDEVIHIRYPNPKDQYYGMGNIEAMKPILDIIEAMQRNELGYWRSGGRIIGVLSTDLPLNDEDFKGLRREWALANRDDQARARTAVLSKGLKYTPVAEGFKSLDIVNIDKAKRDQILAVFGVPAPKLGIMDNAGYKLADADMMFYGETMQPKFRRVEDALQPLVDLFHGGEKALLFDRKNFEDDTRKFQNAQIMLMSGFLLDEARVYCGAPKLPNGGGQVILLNSALTPVAPRDMGELADQTVQPPAPPTPPAVGSPGAAPPGRATGSPPGANADEQGTGAPIPKPPTPGSVPRQDTGIVNLSDYLSKKAFGMSNDEIEAQLESDVWTQHLREMAVRRHSVKMLRSDTSLARRLAAAQPVARPRVKAATGHALLQDRSRYWLGSKDRATRTLKAALGLDATLTPEQVGAWLSAHENGGADGLKAAVRDAIAPAEAPVRTALRSIHAAAFRAGYATGTAHVGAASGKALTVIPGAKQDAIGELGIPDYVGDMLPATAARLGAITNSVIDTTVDDVYDVVMQGIDAGYDADMIVSGVEDDSYGGLSSILDDADQWRAQMIARTSIMQSYNAGNLASYADAGVEYADAVDGTDDPECAERNGQTFSLDEADQALSEEHPNGTLGFIPNFDTAPASADEANLDEVTSDGGGVGDGGPLADGDGKGFGDPGSTQGRAEKGEFGPSTTAAGVQRVTFARVYGERSGFKGSGLSKAQVDHIVAQRDRAIRECPKPTAKDVQRNKTVPYQNRKGNSYDARSRAQTMLRVWGDGKTCRCVWCGEKIRLGTMTQDRIFTDKQGGQYRVSGGVTGNLVPTCGGCNYSGQDRPLR